MSFMDKKIIIAIAAIAVVIGTFAAVTLVENYSIGTTEIDAKDTVEIRESAEIITEDHKRAEIVVTDLIEQYEKDVDFDALQLGFNFLAQYPRYGFVIDMDTKIIVAHPNEELIGQDSFALKNSVESEKQIISTLNNDGKIWVHYDFENPETEELESKTSLFQVHDGYIFGSGFYN